MKKDGPGRGFSCSTRFEGQRVRLGNSGPPSIIHSGQDHPFPSFQPRPMITLLEAEPMALDNLTFFLFPGSPQIEHQGPIQNQQGLKKVGKFPAVHRKHLHRIGDKNAGGR